MVVSEILPGPGGSTGGDRQLTDSLGVEGWTISMAVESPLSSDPSVLQKLAIIFLMTQENTVKEAIPAATI